jgi:hypothetical protein
VIIFNYVEDMVDMLETEEHYKVYMKFLLDLLNFKIEEPHIDLFIKQTLEILERHVKEFRIPGEVLKEQWPTLYSRVLHLVNLRYNDNVCKVLGTAKPPLWHKAGITLMNIAGLIIDPNYSLEKQVHTESDNSSPYNSGLESDNEEELKLEPLSSIKKPKPSIKIPDEDDFAEELIKKNKPTGKESNIKFFNDYDKLKRYIWESILKALKDLVSIRKPSHFLMEKYLVENVVMTSQQLAISVCDFILKLMLPNATNIEECKELVEVIENGYKSYYKWLYATLNSESVVRMPYNCLSLLLEMANGDVSESVIPVLIVRSKEIIKVFIEKKRTNETATLIKY